MTIQLSTSATAAASIINARAPGFKPKLGLILGSGLGGFADHLSDPIFLSYAELPGFPMSTVPGHAGRLVLGWLGGVPVACLQGRAHGYEGVTSEAVQTLIRTLKLIGCDTVFITNSAGSLRSEVGPGSLMMITDHINFQGNSPLLGQNDDRFGPRFVSLDEAYDPALRERLSEVAKHLDVPLSEGVYIAVSGPHFETHAEIRAFKMWGADAVGMSTVPEVIIARHCGLRVIALSTITNLAAGMSDEKLSHEMTLLSATSASDKISHLIIAFIESLHHEPC